MSVNYNDIEIMSHEEAVSIQAAERYLLGELTDEQRDAFEAHYFDCQSCFQQVQLATEFLHHARKALEAEPAKDPEPHPGWLAAIFGDFRRPAMAFVSAMLLCAIGIGAYQYEVISGLREPRVEARYTLAGDAKGGPAKTVNVARNTALSLRVDYLRKPEFVSYRAQILNEAGKPVYSMAIPASQTEDSVVVSVLADTLKAGRYSLVVYGLANDGKQEQAGQGNFDLQFTN
jgi:Putative zinc-finger